MRCLLQRVKSASVSVAGQTVGEIAAGLLVFIGVGQGDSSTDVEWMAHKILPLRIFEDAAGKSNLSVVDVQGELLVVSQFTLYGDCRKGTRPSFSESAPPELAEQLYLELIAKLKSSGLKIQTGQFRATMDVQIHNWGPYTVWLDSRKGV